jgi:hypothetical protein
MSERGGAPPGAINWAMPFVIAWILIGSFLWRVVVTAHEYPGHAEQVMTMLIDLGLVVGLVGMRGRVPKPLFWCAVIAGGGSSALRLNGDDGWWTGHLNYSFPSR